MKAKPNALVTQPLKTSQATGACLATMGIQGAIPLMHSAQGCSAFAKVALIQHYREPMPIQTTAMDQVSAVMGAEDNIVEAIQLLRQKYQPSLISLISTGLSDMQGCDLKQAIKSSLDAKQSALVTLDTPDFNGSLQTGFAKAVLGFVQYGLQHRLPMGHSETPNVNVLVSSGLTSADIEHLKTMIRSFQLNPIMIPDLGQSLNGHLADASWQPFSDQGTQVTELCQLHHSVATLVFGASLRQAGDLIQQQTQIPSHYFDHWLGMAATDQLLLCLQHISGQAVAPIWLQQRKALQDTLLDTHAILSEQPIVMAAELDESIAYQSLLSEIGLQPLQCIVPCDRSELNQYPMLNVGDLASLNWTQPIKFAIGNSHLAAIAAQHQIPTHRMGFPVFDRIGAQDQLQIGYQGARQQFTAWANLLLSHAHDAVPVHRSQYAVLARSAYAV